MLQWTTLGGEGKRFAGIVHHTDREREFAYDKDSHMGRLDKATVLVLFSWVGNVAAADKLNILVIWGDDAGMYNINAYHNGMMGGRMPNIVRMDPF